MIRRLDLAALAPFVLTSGASGVWVAGRSRLALHDARTGSAISTPHGSGAGELRGASFEDAPVAVEASDDRVVLCVADGLVVVSLRSDRELQRLPTPTVPDALAVGDGRIWAGGVGADWILELDAAGVSTIRRLDGRLAGLTADAQGLWWIESDTDLLVNGDRSVRLPDPVGPTVGLVASAGAVWVSTDGGLLLVRSFAAEVGPTVPVPIGPVDRLVDVSGALVGGDSFEAVFVMDPASDSGPRRVDMGRRGPIASIAGSSGVVWIADGDGDTSVIEL